MRKNRLIALIGTLTMAAAGLAAVSAGVSSKKADSVSAATENKDCITFTLEDQVGGTSDGRNPILHFWDITVDSSMGYAASPGADLTAAGFVNDLETGSTSGSNAFDGTNADSGFNWAGEGKNGDGKDCRYWTIHLPWYVTGCRFTIKHGDYYSHTNLTVSGSGSYMIYMWNYWSYTELSLGAKGSSGESHEQAAEKYAISATANPSAGGTATIKGNGGSAVASGNYFKRQKITAKATANSGYAFSSWSDSGTAEHTFYASQDVALTANFTANSYTVTLNANEGTGGPASVSATYGAAMPTLSSLPSRVGYTFAGYYDDVSAGNQYYDKDGNSVRNWDKASTATLYAHWTPNPKTTYTVNHYQQNTDLTTYTLHEYDNMSGPTASQTQAVAHTYSGFTSQSFSQTTIAADGSTVVDIYYDRNPYTMSYSLGEKPSGTVPTAVTMYYGCTPNECGVTLPDLSGTWEDHDFNGWKYLGQGQDLPITQTTPYAVAGPITITAQWSLTPVSSYSVSFVIADGQSSWGSLSSSTGSTTLSVAADSTISVNNNVMTIDGKSVTATAATDSTGQYTYAFKSFSPNSGTINADTVITVEFSQTTNQYSLAWDFDEGTPKGSYSPAGDYNWGATITVPNDVSKEGCSFDGLFFDSDFTNPCDDDFEIKENTTVYAKFTGLTYDVSVGVDSSCAGWGTVSSTIVEDVPYNTSISALNNVLTVGSTKITATAKTGPEATYSFLRWDGIPASEKVTDDLNIKAVFSKVDTKCQLTWDFAGGSTSDTEYTVSGKYVYGTLINAPTTSSMSKDGYKFAGWDNEVASTLTSDQTYTAQWTRVDGYYIHVFGTNERYVKMSSNGGTEYVATIELAKDETFKITTITDGSEGLWSGWSAVKYDTGDGPHVDARSNAQVVDDGSDNHNIKANLAGTNTYKVFYDTNESWIDDVGGYHTYIPSIVNVEFDLNGKTGTAPANQIAYARGHVTEPEDPTTTESYEFEGWYGEAACTNKWNFDENQLIYFSVDSSTHVATQKIYANWTSTASYNITLNNNGGTGGETSINDVHVGDEISVSSIPEKLNNTFTGYWTEGGTKVIDSDGSNETPYQESFGTTLNAGWTLNPGTYLWVKGDSAQDGARKMTLNGGTGTQYVWKNITLAANDEIRCYYDNGNYGNVNSITWSHPDYQGVKEGDNCKVLVAGTYDIYYDTTSGEMHLSMPSMPENGRYLVVNNDKSKDALHLMGEHQGYTGKEYLYQGYFQKDDIISAYYQDSTQATQYYPSLYESVKVWNYIPNQGLKCPEAGTYSIYLISEDGGDTYNKISIFKEGEADAVNFANKFLDKMDETCDLQEIDEKIVVNTKIEELQAAWLEMKQAFDELPSTSKAYLTNAVAVYDKDSTDKLGKFAASYDYIYGKYHASLGVVEGVDYGGDFAQRNPKLITNSRLFSVSEVSTSTWIIASVAIVGIAAVGVFFIYRKRKEI